MEDGLVQNKFIHNIKRIQVLILVVVEDGLVQGAHRVMRVNVWCLNPCCSGRWSRTYYLKKQK